MKHAEKLFLGCLFVKFLTEFAAKKCEIVKYLTNVGPRMRKQGRILPQNTPVVKFFLQKNCTNFFQKFPKFLSILPMFAASVLWYNCSGGASRFSAVKW